MKKLAIPAVLILTILSVNACALTGLGVGVRGGYVSGYDNPQLAVFSESIDKLQMLGVHLQIGFLPIVDLDVSGEYAWESQRNFVPGIDLTYGDLSVNGTVTYGLSVPVVKPYVGLGLGLHRLVYLWDGDYAGVLPDDQTKMSWHGLGGVSLGFPAFPFQIFVEARYTSLQTESDKTNFTSILGGVTLGI
jgi:hypothetical protein